MEIREYDMMTDEARGIRTAVFVVEKDYRPEFDEWDEPGRATHLLAFGNGRAVATCRLYPELDHADQPGRWVIGRLAVVADERGHGIGKTVLAEAEHVSSGRPVDMLPPYTPKIRISQCMNILATASPASFSTTVRMVGWSRH